MCGSSGQSKRLSLASPLGYARPPSPRTRTQSECYVLVSASACLIRNVAPKWCCLVGMSSLTANTNLWASVDVSFHACGASMRVARQVLHLKDTTEAAGTPFIQCWNPRFNWVESFLARETPEFGLWFGKRCRSLLSHGQQMEETSVLNELSM